MDLTHRFTVPVPIDEAWAHFNDIGSVAECFPGASVTSAEGDTFAGSVKVKLGPIALVYNGSGTFTEKDEATHRMVVDAKGKDKRGNGTAGAAVVMTMTPSPGAATSTDIEVITDLAITGKPAQFGRGVMQDVSDKLLGQFVACLEQRLAGPGPAAGSGSGTDGPPTDEPAPTPPPGADVPAPGGDPATLAPPPPAPPRPAPTPPPPIPPAPPQAEALDLGSAVLPVLAKAYWRQTLVALVVLVLLRRLLRRT